MSVRDLVGVDGCLAGEVEDRVDLELRVGAEDPGDPGLGDRAVALEPGDALAWGRWVRGRGRCAGRAGRWEAGRRGRCGGWRRGGHQEDGVDPALVLVGVGHGLGERLGAVVTAASMASMVAVSARTIQVAMPCASPRSFLANLALAAFFLAAGGLGVRRRRPWPPRVARSGTRGSGRRRTRRPRRRRRRPRLGQVAGVLAHVAGVGGPDFAGLDSGPELGEPVVQVVGVGDQLRGGEGDRPIRRRTPRPRTR